MWLIVADLLSAGGLRRVGRRRLRAALSPVRGSLRRRADENESKFIAREITWEDMMNSVRGRGEVIVGKHRHGPTGTVRLLFEGQITKFANFADPARLPEVPY